MTDTASFGAQEVPLADKQALVDDVFHSVARRYDLMNDLMSFGLHRAWKDALVTAVNPPKDLPLKNLPPRNKPFALLDIAGAPATSPFASSRRVVRERKPPSAISTRTCSPSAASALRRRGLARR